MQAWTIVSCAARERLRAFHDGAPLLPQGHEAGGQGESYLSRAFGCCVIALTFNIHTVRRALSDHSINTDVCIIGIFSYNVSLGLVRGIHIQSLFGNGQVSSYSPLYCSEMKMYRIAFAVILNCSCVDGLVWCTYCRIDFDLVCLVWNLASVLVHIVWHLLSWYFCFVVCTYFKQSYDPWNILAFRFVTSWFVNFSGSYILVQKPYPSPFLNLFCPFHFNFRFFLCLFSFFLHIFHFLLFHLFRFFSPNNIDW
jgi:hypothetical protein